MRHFHNPQSAVLALRVCAVLLATLLAVFLLNHYLVYWLDFPEFWSLWYAPNLLVVLMLLGYGLLGGGALAWVFATQARTLQGDAELYQGMAWYVIRASFWAVLLIGLVDMAIAFLRVENLLPAVVGEYLATQLGRPTFRGVYVHYPLLVLALIIATRTRGISFVWLAFLVVLAEFQVVLSRFVFSYEQAFMGDLVRFWYAGLFLFASAYTLASEGHVRVDVLYANFSPRRKAMVNSGGALLLGLPLVWTILIEGLSSRGASISSPLLSFEISQSGYGMYVKYLMAGFLLIFAVSMALQFISSFLSNAEVLVGGDSKHENQHQNQTQNTE